MSIQYKHSGWMNSVKQGYDRLRGKVRSPSVHWLRPMGKCRHHEESGAADIDSG